MNDYSKFQPEELLKAAKEARIPENVQQMAGDTLTKTHDAYQKMTDAAKEQVKVAEEVMSATQVGVKELGEKVAENFSTNTEAAFGAAQAIATADTIPEAMKLQSDFMQQQMAIVGSQTKEFFELSTKLTQDAFQTMNAASSKSFEQFKNTN